MLAISVTMYFDLACSVPFFCHVSHLVQTLGRRDMLFIISLTSQVSQIPDIENITQNFSPKSLFLCFLFCWFYLITELKYITGNLLRIKCKKCNKHIKYKRITWKKYNRLYQHSGVTLANTLSQHFIFLITILNICDYVKNIICILVNQLTNI